MAYDSNGDMEAQGWVLLATIDEADSYEIDENHILYHPATSRFLLRSASGCSCWDGDYGEMEFPTLDAIEAQLATSEGVGGYNPTLVGGQQLMAEARAAFAKLTRPVGED